eukprot:5702678-Amphidinium_carterae.1
MEQYNIKPVLVLFTGRPLILSNRRNPLGFQRRRSGMSRDSRASIGARMHVSPHYRVDNTRQEQCAACNESKPSVRDWQHHRLCHKSSSLDECMDKTKAQKKVKQLGWSNVVAVVPSCHDPDCALVDHVLKKGVQCSVFATLAADCAWLELRTDHYGQEGTISTTAATTNVASAPRTYPFQKASSTAR